LGFHLLDYVGSKAIFRFRANLSGVFDDVVFAFEAAIDEAGQGVEEAEAVEGAGLHGVFEAVRAEVDDGLADLGYSDLWRGLVAGKAFGAAGEVECEFVADFAFFDALPVSKPIAVTAVLFPSGNVMGRKIFDF
jgi:hypothetical protein